MKPSRKRSLGLKWKPNRCLSDLIFVGRGAEFLERFFYFRKENFWFSLCTNSSFTIDILKLQEKRSHAFPVFPADEHFVSLTFTDSENWYRFSRLADRQRLKLKV